ncbi:ABC-2 type transport system permease protein [Novosphingobium kunmingense]|uniref:ABC-2 type transport system permease protein n=1 Tax=Novosphingobium kunmingense TaxID=1211806 RepID=A0A2N0H5H9_9SPHN|nr:ABC transporter permease [Novosphingobium kunmingense]PKB14174.1 ABC-2 type transport system permease protein [Novosphingobium kunmingense]
MSRTQGGRLSTLAAAYVVARRDFVAILFSRSFIFFLLGPLFPLLVGGLAGGIGARVQQNVEPAKLGIAMSEFDILAMTRARHELAGRLDGLPDLVEVKRLEPGEAFDPAAAMRDSRANLGAIVTGSPQAPVLTGPVDRVEHWKGEIELIAAEAAGLGPKTYPTVTLGKLTGSKADTNRSRVITAQMGQVVLFLLTMLLAGMVLSNLVEEKGNKIIEVLAAAIPMDAVFLGKLFAMLAVSWVGLSVWGLMLAAIFSGAGQGLGSVPAPAVGWPAFFALAVAYFSLAYLLLGSLFLAIGSLATTVREVQTLSMPVSMLQLLNFFFASWAMSKPGSAAEIAGVVIPFSSPFTMIARAAQDPALWPHALGIAWQVFCVALLVRLGAKLFRRWVMKSGPAGVRKRRWFGRRADRAMQPVG